MITKGTTTPTPVWELPLATLDPQLPLDLKWPVTSNHPVDLQLPMMPQAWLLPAAAAGNEAAGTSGTWDNPKAGLGVAGAGALGAQLWALVLGQQGQQQELGLEPEPGPRLEPGLGLGPELEPGSGLEPALGLQAPPRFPSGVLELVVELEGAQLQVRERVGVSC